MFDLRTTRDLSSRRVWRENLRRLARIAVLGTGDAIVTMVAVRLLVMLSPQMLPSDWVASLPRILTLVLFGQAAAGTFGAGRTHAQIGDCTKGIVASQLALALLDYAYGNVGLSGRQHVALFLLVVTLLCTWRVLLAAGVREVYASGVGRKRTLIVADREDAGEILERFRTADDPHIEMAGFVSPSATQDREAIGAIGDLARLIEERDIRNVVIGARLKPDQFRQVINICLLHGAAVSVVPGLLGGLPCRISSRDILGWPLLELEAPRLHMLQVTVKRAVDVLLSILLLIVTAPVFAAIAVAIKRDSSGPIFFRQRRHGLAGRAFWMLKFRTMRADAEQVLKADSELYQRYLDNDCKLPADEDPRISRVGRFLRATSLDELPQLINVLRGDMSLIGPRPVVTPELDYYGEWMPVVLGVRPGMTGYWQVAGRSNIMFPERAHLDVFYVTRWTLALDFKILLLTLPAVIKRSGAH